MIAALGRWTRDYGRPLRSGDGRGTMDDRCAGMMDDRFARAMDGEEPETGAR